MKFYNRKKEIDFFNKINELNRKVFIVLYGRRRIGKTTLIKEVYKNKKNTFYFFVEAKKEETLLKEISLLFSKGIYTNWYDLFSDLFKKFKYIIFDEFQNFFKVNKEILYALQHAWDENRNNNKLIVLGSYVGMIKKIFTDEKMPMFGRNDYILKIKDFSLMDSLIMLKDFGYNIIESLEIYGITGGIPKYLWLFQNKKNLKDLVYELFVDDFAPLKEEAKNILITEFGSEHRSYFSILESLSGGMRTSSEISDISGIPQTNLPKFLNELSDIYEIIVKEKSLFGKNSKNFRYVIKDSFYNFYFYHIYKNYSLMEFAPQKAIEKIKDTFNTFMGFQFEEISKRFIMENPDLFGFTPEKIGKIWGRVPYKKNESYDIDIVAYDKNNIVFTECKWTNKKVDIDVYDKLRLRSEFLNVKNKNIIYAIFSKSGFSNELLKLKGSNLYLFSPKDIENIYNL
ncbi:MULTISPECIES: ATP-binding protein [unclassified Marinitoga]|uniref:ATP-binding protein n=1 Tax=unclassified Marinitoga TaxID=2640159 RepID=UPI00064177AE|nr:MULTISPECIES: ATP-binding protein [unclassified Marinitoga]KLO22998.1 ATPase [Marinitoga sp. 1155]NUV00024.1 ATPase [Marinitoga sp. 1154]